MWSERQRVLLQQDVHLLWNSHRRKFQAKQLPLRRLTFVSGSPQRIIHRNPKILQKELKSKFKKKHKSGEFVVFAFPPVCPLCRYTSRRHEMFMVGERSKTLGSVSWSGTRQTHVTIYIALHIRRFSNRLLFNSGNPLLQTLPERVSTPEAKHRHT